MSTRRGFFATALGGFLAVLSVRPERTIYSIWDSKVEPDYLTFEPNFYPEVVTAGGCTEARYFDHERGWVILEPHELATLETAQVKRFDSFAMNR